MISRVDIHGLSIHNEHTRRSRSKREDGPVVSPLAGRASSLAVGVPPSSGEASEPLFFASRGRWSFFRRLGLPMHVGSRGNGAALRQAPFAGEIEGTPVSSLPLLFRFGVRVSVGGVSLFDLCLYRTNLEAKPALIPML